MLYEWLTSSGPVLAGLACGIAVTLIVGFFVLRRMAVLDERIGLVVKAAYQNTREINQNTREINGFANGMNRLATQTEAATQYHRKAHDQQRVLLASLNKQMRHLETLLGQANARPAPSRPMPDLTAASATNRPLRTAREGNATGRHKERIEATPFSEIFGTSRRPANGDTANGGEAPKEAVLLSRLFEQRGAQATEQREKAPAAPAAGRPPVGNYSGYSRKVING